MFEAVRGSGFQSDIAIDDVLISSDCAMGKSDSSFKCVTCVNSDITSNSIVIPWSIEWRNTYVLVGLPPIG